MLYRIRGIHRTSGDEQIFEFSSIRECAYHNQGYKRLKIIGFA